jgi:hypothetical protein
MTEWGPAQDPETLVKYTKFIDDLASMLASEACAQHVI